MKRVVVLVLCGFVAAVAAGAEEISQEMADEVNRKFAGLSFGVGLSVTADTGDRDRVASATIDPNGIVRVSKREDVRARVMLESHYFFPWKQPAAKEVINSGFGPFVALQPGTDEIIESIGIGIMFGWRRQGSESGDSFNLGIGFAVDPSVTVLGDEFVENMPAPVDPDGNAIPIRLEERDQGGILVLASFAWQ